MQADAGAQRLETGAQVDDEETSTGGEGAAGDELGDVRAGEGRGDARPFRVAVHTARAGGTEGGGVATGGGGVGAQIAGHAR